jgi:hypothetical protein
MTRPARLAPDVTTREEYRGRVLLALAVLSHRGDGSPLCVLLERVLQGMPIGDLAEGERR